MKQKIAKILALFFAVAMLPLGMPAAAAPAPGDPDYIAVTTSITPTATSGVYTLELPPPPTTPVPAYVAITLDRSPSMGNATGTDIYDSVANATITRFLALDYAVASTIDALVATGNPDIYINLSTHEGSGGAVNPSGMPSALVPLEEPSHFVSLYSAPGVIRPIFDKNNPAWIMKGWDVSPPTNPNGWTGHQNNFAVAFDRIHRLFREGLDPCRFLALCTGDGRWR